MLHRKFSGPLYDDDDDDNDDDDNDEIMVDVVTSTCTLLVPFYSDASSPMNESCGVWMRE